MSWLLTFFSSSIGRKLIMSLTGIFFLTFLIIHLLGNLQLLKNDGGESFNVYAEFMGHNPLIKIVSYLNYFFLILHAFIGISLAIKNKNAKGSKYASGNNSDSTWASKNMALLGTLILAFLFIHMGDFWYKMKTHQTDMVTYGEHTVQDLYTKVYESFKITWVVVAYIIGQIVLAFHLLHGFSSAFQTLGINHSKYNPFIKGLGVIYSILIPLGFAIIPIIFYFFRS